MKLTKATITKLALPDNKSELLVFDETLPGFGLRIRAGGKRSWIAQYRVGLKQRRVTLGTTETVDADEARKRAKDVLSKVHLGQDPQVEKAEAKAQASATVRDAVKRYLAEHGAVRLKPRSLSEADRYLKRHWSSLAELPVKKVARADVAEQLVRIAKNNGPHAANRARAALSGFFSWAMGEGLADSNPVIGSNKATDENARDRVLTNAELALVWSRAGDGDYAAILKVLILTGQRRDEVGGMLWSELDLTGGAWRIGAARVKNGREHDLPLSAQAVEILTAITRRKDRDLVFGASDGPFSGWSKSKERIDARMLNRLREADLEGKLTPWRLHDLRRTTATRMADLGVLPHVIEAVLNHVSGHKAGVAGVYNRSSYGAEKKAALTLWGDYVAALTNGASR